MSICWYCYWGWAKPVYDIYQQAVEKLGGDNSPLVFGPSHIVWEDENWDQVDWCLDHFNEFKNDFSEEDLTVVRWSLEELAKLPLSQRDIEPEDYDGENPDQYPPALGVITVRV